MTPARPMLKTLWDTDARLTGVGLLMFALLAVTGVALLVDPRQVMGAPAWMKPAKFAISIGIYTLTLAWVFTHVPEWTRMRRVVSWITAVMLVLEIIWRSIYLWEAGKRATRASAVSIICSWCRA